MNILIANILYHPYSIGGAEKSVKSLAENLSNLGHNIIVITLGESNKTSLINNVRVQKLKIQNSYFPFNQVEKKRMQKLIWHINDVSNKNYETDIKTILKSFKTDIVFTNNITGFSTQIWQIASQLKIKIVHTLRDYYLQCPKTTKFKNDINCKNGCLDCNVLSIIKKKHSHKIDYVIGISNYILQDHLNKGYFKNVPNKVIYNGFDFNNTIEKKRKIKGNVVFGFIGQINKAKGIEFLLDSFLKVKNINWQLLIAGNIETDYLNYLKERNNSEQIEFLGFTNSSLFFDRIDVLIVPSLWNEPFGRIIVESLIHKKPVIASKRGGIVELLSNNKDFIFDPDNNDLNLFIEKAILNQEFLDSFVFDQEFLNKFKIEAAVQDYLYVFNKILGNENKIK